MADEYYWSDPSKIKNPYSRLHEHYASFPSSLLKPVKFANLFFIFCAFPEAQRRWKHGNPWCETNINSCVLFLVNLLKFDEVLFAQILARPPFSFKFLLHGTWAQLKFAPTLPVVKIFRFIIFFVRRGPASTEILHFQALIYRHPFSSAAAAAAAAAANSATSNSNGNGSNTNTNFASNTGRREREC